VYQSTTGTGGSGGNYVYNWVACIATHEIDAIQNLYLDGRQVYWSQFEGNGNVGCGTIPTTDVSAPPVAVATISGGAVTGITATGGSGFNHVKAARYRVRITGGGGSGAYAYATNSGAGGYGTDFVVGAWTVTMVERGTGYTSAPDVDIQGVYTFGGAGAADQQDPSLSGFGLGFSIGPNGVHYDFAGKVYCEVRFGDQPPSDYMSSLSANDSTWPSTANLGGNAYIYLNVGFDAANFPNPPEIRMTVNGKNTIFDPRDGKLKFTTNWALQTADVITDPVYGLNDPTVNQAQLIAAANICDEQIATSQGYESRYSQSLHFDTGTAPGDQLTMMMPAAAGRFSRVGGEWFIFPGAWVGPSAEYTESAVIGEVEWLPTRKERELFNQVSGTFISPNYPYSAVAPFSNLYDTNGFYFGSRDNLWNFAFQSTNYPMYQQDMLHGYAANQWLVEDGGVPAPHELTLRGVLSIVQAQRLAKIELLRNRWQASGTFPMSIKMWGESVPLDVIEMTFPTLGLDGEYMELDKIQLSADPSKDATGEDGAIALTSVVNMHQTDPSIYEWSESEELTPYDVPVLGTGQIPNTPAAPTEVTVTSSAGTAIIGADGSVTPRALVAWNAPLDITVISIQLQYQAVGATTWLSAGTVDVGLFESFVTGVIAGAAYNFEIRSLRASGTYSAWVEVEDVTISITLPVTVTNGNPTAPAGTLIAIALVGGTANIIVNPYVLDIFGNSVDILPAGPYTITGLEQGQNYYAYYIDGSFLGGAITPIATLLQSDYVNKLAYFLIGSIVTPTYSPSYAPSTFATSGAVTVTSPQNAYDGSLATCASLPAVWYTVTGEFSSSYYSEGCSCTWSGFPAFTTTAAMNLNVVLSVATSGVVPSTSCGITATVAGVLTTLATITSGEAETTLTLAVPIGTDISTIGVTATASITAGTSPGTGSAVISVFEIYAQ
jgi:hypothetical protein